LGVNSKEMERCFKNFEDLIGTNALRESLQGWHLIQSNMKDEALQVLETISSHQSEVPYWVQFNIGVLYESKQDSQQAIQAYEKCLVMRQNDPELLFRLGVLLAKQKRWSEALDKLEKANTIKPDWAKALHQQGAVLLKIIQNGITIQGKNLNNLNQEMIKAYTNAERIYLTEGDKGSNSADVLRLSLKNLLSP
jgi:tetratricopeptide (TPR) repeat protein